MELPFKVVYTEKPNGFSNSLFGFTTFVVADAPAAMKTNEKEVVHIIQDVSFLPCGTGSIECTTPEAAAWVKTERVQLHEAVIKETQTNKEVWGKAYVMAIAAAITAAFWKHGTKRLTMSRL